MNKYAIAFAFLLAVAVALPHEAKEEAVTNKQPKEPKDGEKTGDKKPKDGKENAESGKETNSAPAFHFAAITAI
ncbi:hypothetical protein IWQ61_008322, partial [Dispira simplex]